MAPPEILAAGIRACWDSRCVGGPRRIRMLRRPESRPSGHQGATCTASAGREAEGWGTARVNQQRQRPKCRRLLHCCTRDWPLYSVFASTSYTPPRLFV